jgi:Ribonuclease G/E
LALAVLRKIQDRVTQDDFNVIKGTLSKTVAEYLLNYKRDDLNAIERKYGLQIVIVGDETMPVEEFHFDFVKKDKPSAAIEDTEDKDKNKRDKPWYKRLLPV